MLFKLTNFPKHVFIFEGMKNVQETLGLFGNHGKLQNFNSLYYLIISFSFSIQKRSMNQSSITSTGTGSFTYTEIRKRDQQISVECV